MNKEANNIHSNESTESNESSVTEFELQMWRVFYGFLRWQEECEKYANGTHLSGNELAILHIVKMNNRSKTITDIERLLNRADIHNIRYSLNKLLKLGLIKKSLSNFNGKNYLFEVTEAGINDINKFSALRKNILVKMFQDLNLDLEAIAKNLSRIKAIYDEADRTLSHTVAYSKHSNQTSCPNSKPLGRVLLVEDHPTAAKITKRILNDLNYQVDIASSGDMAINHTEQHKCDIIFMDIGLPDIDGCEITRNIRTNKNSVNINTPIIGLTVHDSIDHEQKCLEAGMNAVFIKPLIKEKASEIFELFIPKLNQPSDALEHDVAPDNKLLSLTGNAIDLSQGSKLVGGNEELAREAIEMLVESFSDELSGLEKACKSFDVINTQAIIHKLLGGISYCGVPRLSEACIEFNEYLKSGQKELMIDFFNLLRFEYTQVKEKLLTEST